jgi:hypothetical protein
MAQGFLFVMDVEVMRKLIKANSLKRFGKPAETRHAVLPLEGNEDEFHSIASGDDHRFFDFRFALEPAKGFRDDPVIQRKAFTKFKGGLACD